MFKRSSYCNNSACLEADLNWHKSSASGPTGNCLEAQLFDNAGERIIAVRNSRVPGVVSLFDEEEWNAFLQGAKEGEFDLS